MPRLTLAWRLARREFDHGLVGFRVFLTCLALGVAAIAGVGSTAKALLRGLEDNGRAILGEGGFSEAEIEALAARGVLVERRRR